MQPFLSPKQPLTLAKKKTINNPKSLQNWNKIKLWEGKCLWKIHRLSGRFIKTPNFLIQLSRRKVGDNNQLILFKHKTTSRCRLRLLSQIGLYSSRRNLSSRAKVNFSWICISYRPIQFKNRNIWCTKWISGRELHANRAIWFFVQKFLFVKKEKPSKPAFECWKRFVRQIFMFGSTL